MIETFIAGKTYDAITRASLRELQTPDEAKELLTRSDERYEEIEGEIQELEGEREGLEALCRALEELIPLWSAAIETPEMRERLELIAAVHHPNQHRFGFLKDGADGENLDR